MKKLVIYFLLVLFFNFIRGEKCTCAVMKENLTEPIFTHVLEADSTCDTKGALECENMCLTLANPVKDNVPTLICSTLFPFVDNLMVGLHTKACNTQSWKFSGLKTVKPVCCSIGIPVSCNVP